MRDIDAGYREGDPLCTLAFHAFCYHIAKTVGAYIIALNGVDVIAFTAGIGEWDTAVRAEILSYFTYLGIKVDDEANKGGGDVIKISTDDSSVKVYAIPTNEELAICRETVRLTK